ncbi:MAG TPA: adenylosuccinate lyase [Nitrososphaeraceae archaeon]|nr:adenylosuccinate lyase [Nitrososphaeraceae archaeon]
MTILPIDSGRYGSKEIKQIFEEEQRLLYEIEFEAAVAFAQAQIGVIPSYASEEITRIAKSHAVSLRRVKELEIVSDHDTAALIEALGELCSTRTKPWIHYGLTSSDVVDTSTSMQIRDVFKVIEPKLSDLAAILINRATEHITLPAVGRTHGQHASIIAFGLKFAVWAAEMAKHIERIEESKKRILLCKTLGVVGTGSLMGESALEVQDMVAKSLGLVPVEAATQVISRERYAEMQFLIALLGASLDKIAIEIRNLQRTELAEVAEPFRQGQIGSSAVPVKRNPIKCERVSSLARMLRSLVNVSMENIPLWHERDLSNSANERFTIPMSAILIDEMLNLITKVISELQINKDRITSNIDITKGQIYAEFVLEALVKQGIPRFEAYREIQRVAFAALQNSEYFLEAMVKDPWISKKMSEDDLLSLFDPNDHLAASAKIVDKVSSLVKETIRKFSFG